MMACLLGLFRTERLAREMSAVTRVMDILRREKINLIDQIILNLKKLYNVIKDGNFFLLREHDFVKWLQVPIH